MGQIHATTIFAVHHNGGCAMAGDGQVTLGNAVVMKGTAKRSDVCLMGRSLQVLQVPSLMHLHFLRCLKAN